MVLQPNGRHSADRTALERSSVGIAVVLMATAVLFAIDGDSYAAMALVVTAVANGMAGVLLHRYGRTTQSDDGRSFRLLGIAAMLGGFGMILFGVVSQFVELAAFGPLDIVFLAMYAALIGALAYMPSPRRSWRAQARLVLDGLVGAVSVSVLVWVFAGSQIMENLSALPLGRQLIGFTYPLLDLSLIIGVMVVILRRGQYRFDVRLLLLVIGFGFQVAADISYLSSSSAGTFQEAEPNFILFIGAAAAFLLTGMMAGRVPPPVEIADRKTPLWAYAVPYGIGLVLGVVTLVMDFTIDSHNPMMTAASFVVLVLVIVRQWIAIQENRVIVEKERRSLIASVSHELRTPLTSMIGFLTLLEDSDIQVDEEERGELLSVVLEQANYMGRMVTDIILLARDQPEKLTLTEQTIGTDDFVASVLDTLGATDARVEVEFEEDMELTVDADRVRQIATNLLNNASKYGGGHALLVVESRQGDLVIEVHDDGPGVPKRYEDAIWERFERGALRLNSTTPGTGLGLAIVEMIAKAHQGTVGYRRSERLGGACFFVRLPGRVSAPDGGVDAAELTSAWQPASARSR